MICDVLSDSNSKLSELLDAIEEQARDSASFLGETKPAEDISHPSDASVLAAAAPDTSSAAAVRPATAINGISGSDGQHTSYPQQQNAQSSHTEGSSLGREHTDLADGLADVMRGSDVSRALEEPHLSVSHASGHSQQASDVRHTHAGAPSATSHQHYNGKDLVQLNGGGPLKQSQLGADNIVATTEDMPLGIW